VVSARRKIFFILVPVLLLLAPAAAFCWPSGYMLSRDIGCARADTARGSEICKAISESMRWTWAGHAIISPGWRPTWAGLRDVYCGRGIGEADLAALEGLRARALDWRLESATGNLVTLLKNHDGSGGEPENSVFHPKNPHYVLKGGCPVR
jgi:hypothetical protein